MEMEMGWEGALGGKGHGKPEPPGGRRTDSFATMRYTPTGTHRPHKTELKVVLAVYWKRR